MAAVQRAAIIIKKQVTHGGSSSEVRRIAASNVLATLRQCVGHQPALGGAISAGNQPSQAKQKGIF